MDDHDRDEAAFHKLLGDSADPVEPSAIFEKKLKDQFVMATRSQKVARRRPLGRVAMMAASLLVAYFGIQMMLEMDPEHRGDGDNTNGPPSLWADEVTPQEYSLTIFNDNLAVIRDQRLVSRIPKGKAKLEFRGVASGIIPQSVRLGSINHPGKLSVLEQNYHYDLANRYSLMQNYVDSEISYLDGSIWRKGTLLAHGSSLIVKGDDGIRITWDGVHVRMPEPIRGLLTRPTLRWELDNEVAGEHQAQIAYLSTGLNWTADHNVRIDESKKTLDLDSWITVTNYSGASFPAAKLKFMAGDVNIIHEAWSVESDKELADDAVSGFAEGGGGGGVSQKAFSEFHLYTLNDQTDLPDRSVKQVRFANKKGVKYRDGFTLGLARYVSHRPVVMHEIRFDNKEEDGAGIPLPAGRVRLNFGIPGDRELIGIRHMDHTPVEEEVVWMLGQTLRISSKATLMKQIRRKGLDHHVWKVELRNNHDTELPLEINIPLSNGTSTTVKITGHDVEQERTDARNELATLKLKPDEEVVLQISVLTTR